VFELIPLDCLEAGQVAEVERLEGRPEHVKRLEEMGLRHGMTVKVMRPGRPCIVRVGCNRLCLRQDTRLCVFVKAWDPAGPAAPKNAVSDTKLATNTSTQSTPSTV